MQIYQTTAGNTAPALSVTAERDSTPINLTGATVSIIISNENTRAVTATIACSITSATTGVVSFSPTAATFPSLGRYLGELKIIYSGNTIERIPERLLIIANAATN